MAGYERDDSLPDIAVPWTDIPTSDAVEPGEYVIRINHFREIKSRESGKRMVVMFSHIDEGPMAGVLFPVQNFVLGTDNDPLCHLDPQTWKTSRGGKQLNQVLTACGTARIEGSLEQSLRRAEDARFRAYVTRDEQKDGPYKGTEQNRITRVAGYGEALKVPGKAPMIAPGNVTEPMVSRNRTRPVVRGQMTDGLTSGPRPQEHAGVNGEHEEEDVHEVSIVPLLEEGQE
jgi:hypothetical protein